MKHVKYIEKIKRDHREYLLRKLKRELVANKNNKINGGRKCEKKN